ncbi:acyl-CoA synthetase [Marinibacterium sp. SX1]|uniref:acyl-CoA synthetase n=1 Tax=Marinibacterium sp. SX1 TaxID=3388424 RepID=UPI003D16C179
MGMPTLADKLAFEAEMDWTDRDVPRTLYALLERTTRRYPQNKATSFQLTSGPDDKAETLTYAELFDRVSQAANLFRAHGIGEGDVISYVLPTCNDTLITFLGGAVAGIVNPINPLLEPSQIAAILRETNSKAVVTLKPFPKTDIAQKVAEAVRHAPGVRTVFEIDLKKYLAPPKSWLIPLIRPKVEPAPNADYLDLDRALDGQPTALAFADSAGDRPAFYFHTGGTTGMPKVAQHYYSGAIYNGWIGEQMLYTEKDVVMCPLPLFHVFACHPVVMGVISSGAHVVFPTPAGYRGEGVFDNFWKLCERWKVTFIFTVPTAIAAKMQRPVDADLSTVKYAFSGSAPLPVELFKRFEKAAGIEIIEGYGMTEATCVVSCNPVDGVKKIGSVGIPFPHTEVRILRDTPDGPMACGTDEIGEICVSNPGVVAGSTYIEQDKNHRLFHHDIYLRTGDLGRIDADGYLWITGRAKDLIIRGGHNIDPAEIEEALLGHEAVAFAGAIGQPDPRTGEMPCAYVELVDGASVTPEELMEYCKVHVHERAAQPKHVVIMDELPKTAVGKIFKPDLRKEAIARVYDGALEQAGLPARVAEVIDDKKRGLTARLARNGAEADAVSKVLDDYVRPWEWSD